MFYYTYIAQNHFDCLKKEICFLLEYLVPNFFHYSFGQECGRSAVSAQFFQAFSLSILKSDIHFLPAWNLIYHPEI